MPDPEGIEEPYNGLIALSLLCLLLSCGVRGKGTLFTNSTGYRTTDLCLWCSFHLSLNSAISFQSPCYTHLGPQCYL